MSTGENEETTLNIFPPEVWSCITIYLPGEQLGRLKFTGSKRLWSRLCQMRSVESINLGTDYLSFRSWPAFLIELPDIRELIIDNDEENWSPFWQPKLNDLPSSLRKLKIRLGPKKLVRIFGKARGLSNRLPLLESLDLDVVWGARNFWLTDMPSSLTSLNIICWDGSFPLPMTLTRLQVAQVDNIIGLPHLPNLEFLKLGYAKSSPNVSLLHLPASLRTFIYHIQGAWSASEIEMIPKSVTHLESFSYFPDPDQDNVQWALPPSLTRLRLFSLHPTYWSDLPTCLKIFTLEEVPPDHAIAIRTLTHPSTGTVVPISTYPIETLPGSITKLKLKFQSNRLSNRHYLCAPSESSSYDPSQSLGLFPPGLVSLKLENAQLSVEAAKQLPTTLRCLSMSFLHRELCEVLPPSLRTLKANFAAVDDYFFSRLPKSLTKLRVAAEASNSDSWMNPHTGANGSSSSAIPGYSSFAPLKAFSHVWTADSCFSNLVSLHLLEFKADLGQLFCPEATLDKMEELHITSPHLLNICFPKNLKKLSLHRCMLSDEFYSQLPRSLTSLEVFYTLAPLFDEDIKEMPPKLEILAFHSGKQLTDACIKDLPRSLRFCSLKASFTAAAIADLPPLLSSRTAKTGMKYCFPSEYSAFA